ncbi:hypothetical protein [Tardiphaga sp. vice278]|uniref:hypothetical protein n=1 Tax=Tardiphaga sp. vice278 TaxID=2592815 RepID=UPI0011633F76|nr:hypothetical protein [Tardiphaga sp. vice278]QDM16833.1 hypothetical protein FNL53_13505 [Tardiphaga sp. vice278]
MRWNRTKSVEVTAIQAQRESSIAVILLTSGHLVKVRGIRLFPVDMLADIGRLRAIAGTKLGGVSSGIGFIGSPGWAIGGGIAVGLLERAIASSAKKEGLTILKDAERKSIVMLQNGVTFPVCDIDNIDHPVPNMWSANGVQVSAAASYVHDGGEFVSVETDVGDLKIRWQHVVSYTIAPDAPLGG